MTANNGHNGFQANERFHAVCPEALDTVFKRLRDTGLLLWDETQRRTSPGPPAGDDQPVHRALQQVDRQRVTLGTTGITSTDVKRWPQTLAAPEHLLADVLAHPIAP